MSVKPFFSIITATWNAAEQLPGLLDSLAGQTCRDFELLIQDGASTDKTLEIAESYRLGDASQAGAPARPDQAKYSEYFDHAGTGGAGLPSRTKRWSGHPARPVLPDLKVSSEPDSGVYDAWNKALPRISGEWALFLGADDQLAGADFLSVCKKALENADDRADFAITALQKTDALGRPFKRLEPDGASVYANLLRGRMLPHTALLHHRRVFAGKAFDTSFKITGDYDFICRAWKRETRWLDIPEALIVMGGGGLSGNPRHIWRLRREVSEVLRRYSPAHLRTPDYFFFMFKGMVIRLLGILPGGLTALDRGKRLLGR